MDTRLTEITSFFRHSKFDR